MAETKRGEPNQRPFVLTPKYPLIFGAVSGLGTGLAQQSWPLGVVVGVVTASVVFILATILRRHLESRP